MSRLTAVHRGHVTEGGTLALDDPARFKASLKAHRGKAVEVVVRRPQSQRSSAQNRYLHGVVLATIADHCGYSIEEMKDALAWHFLGAAPESVGGVRVRRSTADLSTDACVDFTNAIVEWAAVELGLSIPPPGIMEAE